MSAKLIPSAAQVSQHTKFCWRNHGNGNHTTFLKTIIAFQLGSSICLLEISKLTGGFTGIIVAIQFDVFFFFLDDYFGPCI